MDITNPADIALGIAELFDIYNDYYNNNPIFPQQPINQESDNKNQESDENIAQRMQYGLINRFPQNRLINNFISILNNQNMTDVPIVIKDDCLNKLNIDIYNSDKNKESSCTICMDDFNDNEIIRTMVCNHVFHRMCIDKWLTKEDFKCPVCRTKCGDSQALL